MTLHIPIALVTHVAAFLLGAALVVAFGVWAAQKQVNRIHNAPPTWVDIEGVDPSKVTVSAKGHSHSEFQ